MSKNKKKPAVKKVHRRVKLFYVLVLIITCSSVLSYSGLEHYNNHLRSEADVLTSATVQTKLAAEVYFDKLEDASVTLLSNAEYFEFDAADTSNDGYEAARTLDALSKGITELSILDNYCDFAVIYRNSSSAGKLSAGTRELLSNEDNELYPALTDLLGDSKHIWITGVKGDFRKIYYLREATGHSYFLGGFYTQELANVFLSEKKNNHMELIFKNEQDKTVLSYEENGIEPDLSEHANSKSCTVIDYDMISCSDTLENGWKIILVKDMSETVSLYRKIALETAAVLMLALATLIVFNVINLRDEDGEAAIPEAKPATDPITGLSIAEEAENLIADKIETCVSGSTIVLVLAAITNLEEIEEKYGRSGCNGSLIKTSRALIDFFEADEENSPNIVCRTGENEFAVFADFTEYDLFKAHDKLRQSVKMLDAYIKDVHLAAEGDIKINIGAAVYPDSSADYDELYDIAKDCLKTAEASDNVTCVLHKKEKGGRR